VTPGQRAELQVRVQPRAPRTEIAGERAGRLLVRVTAPPAEGRANAAVVAMLAKRLGVPKSSVRILSGHGARDKRIAVEGLTTAQAMGRLRGP
jgi:uncharacterized protein